MGDIGLAEAFLEKLLDPGTATGLAELIGIAKAMGVDNEAQVRRVGRLLRDLGLVHPYSETSTSVACAIAGRATSYHEEHGSFRGILRDGSPRIDQSITIQGGVHQSAIAAHSRQVRQSVAAGAEVRDLLEAMARVIRSDASLTDDDRSDALKDVESLEAQASKAKPDRLTIEAILANLGKLAPLVPLAGALLKHLFP